MDYHIAVKCFLDINPHSKAHTLVVPKKHVTNILDCDTETMYHVMDTVKKISNHYTDDLGYDGVDLMSLPAKKLQEYRGKRIALIFQEPGRSFDPLQNIGKVFLETYSIMAISTTR